DGGAGAVAVEPDDARLAHTLGDLEAERTQLAGELGRRARLLEAELGIGVDVLVERIDAAVLPVEAAPHPDLPPAHVPWVNGKADRCPGDGEAQAGFHRRHAFTRFRFSLNHRASPVTRASSCC